MFKLNGGHTIYLQWSHETITKGNAIFNLFRGLFDTRKKDIVLGASGGRAVQRSSKKKLKLSFSFFI